MIDETKIANRALQRVGAARIGVNIPGDTLWTEESKNADEIRACYDILRRAEQRRNVWRYAVRRVALRPIGTSTKFITFGAWSNVATYGLNDIVLGSDGTIYISKTTGNLNNDPSQRDWVHWGLFFGSDAVQEYVGTWSSTITYAANDHTVGSDGTVYLSLAAGNLNHNPTTDGGVHWIAASSVGDMTMPSANYGGTSFYAGELVYQGATVYFSLQNNNLDAPPSAKWMTFTAAPVLSLPNFIYPIGAGPFTDTATRNVYRLPVGFLRQAPQAPKAGSTSFLGAPSGLSYNDWEFGDNYIITIDSGVIVFRFGADVADPTTFDPMFVEGLASRIAFEVCEPLTQSGSKLQAIAGEYKQFMSEARTVNGIEEGPTQPPEDDYIECRK